MAPESIISLSRLLRTKVLGSNVEADCVLNPLSLEQVVRLVRLLGSYANAEKNLRPQKILNVDQLKVSWSITSSAADLLSSWPLNFIDFLNRLRERHSDVSIGQLPKVFGGFYHALYRRFKEPEFQFLRSAFEAYVIEHWTGGLAKRNRRLEVSALANAAWIPANHACATLGVSRRRLKDLIREGTLSGEVRKTSGQREFIVVRKSEVQAKALEVDTGLPMKFTANRLGLKRARLQKLLPLMCPDAVKIGDQGCPWSIPLHWVETWERLIGSYDVASSAECSFISIAHVLRYWPWKDDQVAAFLNLVYSGSIKSAGRAHGVVGIGGLLFETAVLLDWHSSQYSNVTSELTVPEVAAHLEVKQEVAYSLVRSGKIASSVQFRGRRSEHMVTSETLEHFKRDFVLCRDVAKKLNTSPRAVLASLRSAQVAPVAGPGVDDCRQFFFHRTDVESFMDQ